GDAGVDDEDALLGADLDGGDAGAVGGEHRVRHVRAELTDFVRHLGHRGGGLAQARVWIFHDRAYGHGVTLNTWARVDKEASHRHISRLEHHFDMALATRYAEAEIPTEHGPFRIVVYRIGAEEHVAIVRGEVKGAEAVLCRVHSECLTGEVFGSMKCDCRAQ